MLLKEGIPHLIENSTDGGIMQTSDRRFLARTDKGELAFRIFLNNGASYRICMQQVGEVEDAGCLECGTLTALEDLDEQGYCPGCPRDRWDRLTAEEETTWCKVKRCIGRTRIKVRCRQRGSNTSPTCWRLIRSGRRKRCREIRMNTRFGTNGQMWARKSSG